MFRSRKSSQVSTLVCEIIYFQIIRELLIIYNGKIMAHCALSPLISNTSIVLVMVGIYKEPSTESRNLDTEGICMSVSLTNLTTKEKSIQCFRIIPLCSHCFEFCLWKYAMKWRRLMIILRLARFVVEI